MSDYPFRKHQSRLTRRRLLGMTTLGSAALLAGCGPFGGDSKGPEDLIAWPEKDIWPARLQEMHPNIQETYHYVARNEEIVQWFPCTCGCVDTDNHQSNFDCYVAEKYDDGSILLDTHSFA